jgi:hypothetical protein
VIALRAVESAGGDALHTIFTEPGVRRFLFDDVEEPIKFLPARCAGRNKAEGCFQMRLPCSL